MTDPFENTILCNECGNETEKNILIKNGFKMRTMECRGCSKVWFHPLDMQNYKDFIKLRKRSFQVKLRYVGNSFCVSIPKEIIEFEDLEKQMSKMMNIMLEEPGKLSIFFSRRFSKVFKEGLNEE